MSDADSDVAPVDDKTSAPEDTNQAPEDAKSSDKSLLAGAGGDDKAVSTPANWPEDWRSKLAGDDAKGLKQLERFSEPADVFRSYTELQKKLSSGEEQITLADDASEEDIAAYRESRGIPSEPAGYLESLDGLVVSDEDKADVDSFLESSHAANADPAFVATALQWYNSNKEEQAAQLAQEDRSTAEATAEALRADWGPEYKMNFNSMGALLEAAPEDLGLMDARLPDGTRFGDNETALRWLHGISREINPAGFVAPGEGGKQLDSVRDEIASIEQTMRKDRASYNKDEKMQARYRELLEAEERLAA